MDGEILFRLNNKIPDMGMYVLKDKFDKASAVKQKIFEFETKRMLKNPLNGVWFGLCFFVDFCGFDRMYKGDIKFSIIKFIIPIFLVTFSIFLLAVMNITSIIPIISIIYIVCIIFFIVELFLVYSGIKKDNLKRLINTLD